MAFWTRRLEIKARDIEPGMYITVGFKLHEIESVNYDEISDFVWLRLRSMDKKGTISQLALEPKAKIHVNLSS